MSPRPDQTRPAQLTRSDSPNSQAPTDLQNDHAGGAVHGSPPVLAAWRFFVLWVECAEDLDGCLRLCLDWLRLALAVEMHSAPAGVAWLAWRAWPACRVGSSRGEGSSSGLDWSWETFADVFVFGLVVTWLIGSLSIGKDWERLISWDR